MGKRVRLLEGLPATGPLATAFPAEWGGLGREGTVAEFETDTGKWVANFQPGLGELELARLHPNGHDAIVIASGDLWVVDPEARSAKLLLSPIFSAMEVQDPDGWIFSRQDMALARLGPQGLVWHTRRLSWDGFDQLRIAGNEITGLAWSLSEEWHAFRVNLRTGESSGGTYTEEDANRWERLLVP